MKALIFVTTKRVYAWTETGGLFTVLRDREGLQTMAEMLKAAGVETRGMLFWNDNSEEANGREQDLR